MRSYTKLLSFAACMLILTAAVPAASAAGVAKSPDVGSRVLARSSRVEVVEDGDWVRHNFVEPLPRAVISSIKGERVTSSRGAEGCSYHRSETELANATIRGQVKVEREIASNLNTCEMTLETAILSEDEARHFGVASDKTNSGQIIDVPSKGLTTNATTVGRYNKTYYEDPIWIDVNSVWAGVKWTYTGTCTTSAQFSFAWGWYSPTGWSRTAYWSGTDGPSCAYGASASNTATYQNTWFCDGIPGSSSFDTWTQYDVNYVQGYSNGNSYYEWWAHKWGGCTGLLSYHRTSGYW